MLKLLFVLCLGCALAVPEEELADIAEENPGMNFFEGDIELEPGEDPTDRIAQRNRNYKWPSTKSGQPGADLPYEDTFSGSMHSVVELAVKTLHDKTMVNGKECLRFHQKKSGETAYIRYQTGSGCHTPVGYHHRVSGVTLGTGCSRIGTVMHETLHALGFWHEQSRPDRDQYVTINFANIQSGRSHNFDKYTNAQVDTLGLPYDYESVMHYPAYAFAKNRRIKTITPKKAGVTIGQRTHLSPGDIKEIQIYYGCDTGSGSQTGFSTSAPGQTTAAPHGTTNAPTSGAETCDFEHGLCGWNNVGGDSTDWITRTGRTPSTGTGPNTDHSGRSTGHYLYLEASGHSNQVGLLASPSYPPGYYCLSIYYHMYGQDEGQLKIEAVAGSHRQIIHTVRGNQGNTWHHYLLNIHVTNGNFQFEIEGDVGRSYRSDIAIDDLTVHKGQCNTLG